MYRTITLLPRRTKWLPVVGALLMKSNCFVFYSAFSFRFRNNHLCIYTKTIIVKYSSPSNHEKSSVQFFVTYLSDKTGKKLISRDFLESDSPQQLFDRSTFTMTLVSLVRQVRLLPLSSIFHQPALTVSFSHQL